MLTPTTAAYGTVFAVAFGITLILTPLAGWLARRVGALAQPDERRVHKVPTPYFGGLAMLVGFVVALAVAWRMEAFSAIFASPLPAVGVAVGAVIACGVGTVDDIHPVSPPAKMSGLVLAGSSLYLFGAAMVILPLPFLGDVLLSPDMAPLVTVIWVLMMANATNFIDGLDGLAAGIVAIAAGAFFLYGQRVAGEDVIRPDNPSPLLAIIVVGICIGFLPYNFHPARIFMGDGGALMLGVLMAGSTMLVGGQSPNQFSGRVFFFYLPLIPIVIMGVPLLDTLWAIVRRARKGLSPAAADKDHLHHRLMRLGHGQRRSVLILWAWTGLLSAFVLFPVYTRGRGDAFVPIGLAALGLILYTYLHPGARRTRDLEG